MNTFSLGAIVATLAAVSVNAALAHATLAQQEAPAGASHIAQIQIGHGCGDQATHTLRVQIPEGFYNAKPMPKSGWETNVITGSYAEPFNNHGTQMTEGAREIIWSGGDLPNAFYDEFTIRGTVGPQIAPGTKLYFPTIQECGTATEDWTDVSGNRVPNPAPYLTVTAAGGDAHAGHSHSHSGHDHAGHDHAGAGKPAQADAQPLQVGDLTMTDAYARATAPGAPVGGGYVTLTNGGDQADRLLSASTPVAGRVEIHEMSMDGDVMRMRELTDGLPLPPGETVVMAPGGLHLMLMQLAEPLVEGARIPLILQFEKAGAVDFELLVGPRNAGTSAQHAHSADEDEHAHH